MVRECVSLAKRASSQLKMPPAIAMPSVCPCPPGLPEIWLEKSADPLLSIVRRYARTHGPFTTAEVASRFAHRWTRVNRCRAACMAKASCSKASLIPPAPASSGAIPRCCALCAAKRWRGCGARFSRWKAAFLPGSWHAGRA